MKNVLKIALGVIVVLFLIGWFLDDGDSDTDTQPVAEQETEGADGAEETDSESTEEDRGEGSPDEIDGMQADEEEPEMSQDEFIEACENYKYSDLLRYPEERIGNMIKFKARVVQIMEEEDLRAYRCYTDLASSMDSMMLDNELVILDNREEDTTRIIKDDNLIVYAVCKGTETFTSELTGAESELPIVSMKYCDILPDGDDIMSDAYNSVY